MARSVNCSELRIQRFAIGAGAEAPAAGFSEDDSQRQPVKAANISAAAQHFPKNKALPNFAQLSVKREGL